MKKTEPIISFVSLKEGIEVLISLSNCEELSRVIFGDYPSQNSNFKAEIKIKAQIVKLPK